MPELPEVQTIVNDLEEKVVGLTIVDFWSDYKKAVRPSFSKFKKVILAKTPLRSKGVRPLCPFISNKLGNISDKKCFRGQKVIGNDRRGKHLVLGLSGGYSIVIHLKMIGHLLFKPKILRPWRSKYFGEKVNGYIHHIIYFKNGSRLEFSDMRKFGWLAVVKTSEVEEMKEISQLGIDALSVDLDFKKFNELLEKRKSGKIGIVILDQKWIAGVGNIYRSEIIFEAGIAPERLIKDLEVGERKKLYQAMRKILKKSVKMRGTSTVDYRDTDGKKGNFQNFLKVYGKEGGQCPNCQGQVKRMKLGQRSVFWCRGCQRF